VIIEEDVRVTGRLNRLSCFAILRSEDRQYRIDVRTYEARDVAMRHYPARTSVTASSLTDGMLFRKVIREYQTWEEAEEGHLAIMATFRLLGSVKASMDFIEACEP